MLGLVVAIALWVLAVMYRWRRTTGSSRARLRSVSGILIGGPIALLMIAILSLVPWLSYFVAPLVMLPGGIYMTQLPDDRATRRRMNLRATGKLWIAFGLVVLLLDAWWVVAGSRV
jgi:hypothetical protein